MNKYSKGYNELKQDKTTSDGIDNLLIGFAKNDSLSYGKNRFDWKRLRRFGVVIIFFSLLIIVSIHFIPQRGIVASATQEGVSGGGATEVSSQSEVNAPSSPDNPYGEPTEEELEEYSNDLRDFMNESAGWQNIGTRTVTKYTSTPDQTDETPCIGARADVCKMWLQNQNVCATNEFPFGTRLFVWGQIQGSCIVVDRMNERYPIGIDWYNGFDEDCLDNYQAGDNCPQLWEAQNWGSKEIKIERKLEIEKGWE